MGQSTKQKGDEAETKVLSKAVSDGYSVSIPFGDNDRYDLILDIDGELLRVQVKYGKPEDGVVKFRCNSTVSKKNGFEKKSYHGDIDLFAVFDPKRDRIYWVPIDEAPKRMMHIRVKESTSQSKKINSCSDFTLNRSISRM